MCRSELNIKLRRRAESSYLDQGRNEFEASSEMKKNAKENENGGE